MCVNLHCEKPDGYCSSNDEPAADGTKCGDDKDNKVHKHQVKGYTRILLGTLSSHAPSNITEARNRKVILNYMFIG